jgi:hypothetical protein
MTDDRSLDRAARRFIEVGSTVAPERAVEAALLQIETIPQERDLRIPWRTRPMLSRAAIAVAAVVAVLGGSLVIRQLGPIATPTHTPSSTVAPSPTASTPPSPSPTVPPLTEALVSDARPVTIHYPAGWVATPSSTSYPTIDEAEGDLQAYDRVEGDGSRFIVTSAPLASGQSFDEYRRARDGLATSACHLSMRDELTSAIGPTFGFITDVNCGTLGPYAAWWRAITVIDGQLYVFQLDTDHVSGGSGLFHALLVALEVTAPVESALDGPIRADPDPLSELARAVIDGACLEDPEMPTDAALAVADARGGSAVYAAYAAPDGSYATCHLVGNRFPTLGSRGDFMTACCLAPTVEPGRLGWFDTQGNYAIGRAGAGITHVRIDVDGGPSLNASVSGAWFAAYWAPPPSCGGLSGGSPCPPVRYAAVGLDAAESVLDTIRFP